MAKKNTLEIAMESVISILKGRTEPLSKEQIWQKHREMTGCGGRAKAAIMDAITQLLADHKICVLSTGEFLLMAEEKEEKKAKKNATPKADKPVKAKAEKKQKSKATPNMDLVKKTTKADNMALWADAVRIAGGKAVEVDAHVEEKDGKKEEHAPYTLYCHNKESLAVFKDAGVPAGGWRKFDFATCSTHHQEIAGVVMESE